MAVDDTGAGGLTPGHEPEFSSEPVLVPVEKRSDPRLRKAAWLLAASVLGSILIVPYSISLLKQMKLPATASTEVKPADKTEAKPATKEAPAEPARGLPATIPPGLLPVVMAINVAFEAGLSVIAIALGIGLGPRAGLGTPLLVGLDGPPEERWKAKRAVVQAAVIGVVLGVLIIVSGHFSSRWVREMDANIKMPPAWEGFLASIGAGIREEVWLRFGMMTLFAWLGTVVTRKSPAGPVSVWTANVVAALLFGAIHLPQAAQLLGLTPAIIAFVLIGNGVPGVVWGWLYWRHGLIAAMVSHFTADVVMKTIVPLLNG